MQAIVWNFTRKHDESVIELQYIQKYRQTLALIQTKNVIFDNYTLIWNIDLLHNTHCFILLHKNYFYFELTLNRSEETFSRFFYLSPVQFVSLLITG